MPTNAPASSADTHALTEIIEESCGWVETVKREMTRAVVGQELLVDRLFTGLLANGHVLLEGVPGLAKTLTVKSLANCLNVDFQRVQFTPDLLPADLIGTMIYNQKSHEFTPKLGPIFANIVLADEINRAPAKVQSALLEAMAERQVTLADKTWRLIPSSCSPRRTPSTRRAPTSCPRPRWTGFSSR